MKNLIIGLGTGRCGTASLAHLLKSQPDSTFVHEGLFSGKKYDHFLLPWEVDHSKFLEWEKKIKNLDGKYFGESASYLIQYAEIIIKKYPQVKFVCLKRDRNEVISSFMAKTRGRNHWSLNLSFLEFKDPIWDPIFPKFFTSKKEGIGLYWDLYYAEVQRLQEKYPNKFKIFPTYSLNYQGGMNSIFDFCSFPEEGRVYIRKHENKKKIKDQISSVITPIKTFFKKPQNY